MKRYQSQLDLSRTITNPPPRPPRPPIRQRTEEERGEEIKRNVERVLLEGFWYCDAHDGICEREEGENGRPAWCSVCGSSRISWHPPVDQLVVPDHKLIQPGELV